MENMNNVVMYEKPFKEQIRNNKASKLIRKAIIGLTLAAGLTFTACGSTEYSNFVMYSSTSSYEDFEQEFTSKFKMELTPNDAAGLREINEWFVESDAVQDTGLYRNDYSLKADDIHFIHQLYDWSKSTVSLYGKDVNAVKLIENTIIEDMLNANNLPKEITGLKAEDCSIETEVTAKGITYYAQIRSYNAFEDSETYYRSKITDEGLIQILKIWSTAKENAITPEKYNEFADLANEYIEQWENTDRIYLDQTKLYQEYKDAYLGSIIRNIIIQGDELHTALYNAIHNQYKFNKWKIADNTVDMSKTR